MNRRQGQYWFLMEPIQADKNTDWFEVVEKNMNEVFNKESKNYVS